MLQYELLYVLVFTFITDLIVEISIILLWRETKLPLYKIIALVYPLLVISSPIFIAGVFETNLEASSILWRIGLIFYNLYIVILYLVYRHSILGIKKNFMDTVFASVLTIVSLDFIYGPLEFIRYEDANILVSYGTELSLVASLFLVFLVSLGLITTLYKYSKRTISYYKRNISLMLGGVGFVFFTLFTIHLISGGSFTDLFFLAFFNILKLALIVLVYLDPFLIAFIPVVIDGLIYIDLNNNQFIHLSLNKEDGEELFNFVKKLITIYFEQIAFDREIERQIALNDRYIYLYGAGLRVIVVYSKNITETTKQIIKIELRNLNELIRRMELIETNRLVIETEVKNRILKNLL